MISGLATMGVILTLIGVCWVISGSYLIAWLRRRYQRRPPDKEPQRRRSRWPIRIAAPITAASALALGYALWIEPYRPEVTRVTVPLSQLRRGQRPIRVVHLSDLHSDPKARLEDRIGALVAALDPDLIAFTGDAINRSGRSPAVLDGI